jgi:hypothetical protein
MGGIRVRLPLLAHRRAAAVALGTLLAVALSASPPAAQTALAASPLRIQADAVYTLDPAAGRVHVEIDFRVTDLKPNTAQFIYYYRDLAFAIQPEARSVRVTGGAGSITTKKRQYYVEAIVHLRSNLYYRDSTRFAIRYDLVGGAPRSSSAIRVGAAFATFGVWSWGDVGRSTVEVHTPVGFVNTVDGDTMQTTTASGGQGLRAEPKDPETFFAIVSSDNSAAYGSTRVSLQGGVEFVVHAWPEDKVWNTTVTDTLRHALPDLESLIGLPWPVTHDLNVRERYTPALEGYAGFFFSEDQRIDVTEDLEPLVIVHEASHAWFNDALFTERWIYEGLAEEYAWRVQTDVGGDAGPSAEKPDPKDPGYVALVAWTFPQVIRDQKTDDRERYGYGAAFWVIHQIVTTAGADQMRAAFAAAQAKTTAYVGAGTPEVVPTTNDWRRLLDLVEPIDKPDSAVVESAIRDVAITAIDARRLDSRGPARTEYRALVAAGDGWLPPWYVRRQMDSWGFVGAVKAMAKATAVLQLRDQVVAAAETLGLTPDEALRTAYETATDNLDGATTLATNELAALNALTDAKAKIEAAPDLLTQLGLLGVAPRVAYDAARNAFEGGRLDEAVSSATAASALITGAAAIGQQRLLLAVAVFVGVLVLLGTLVLLRRRRRQRRLLLAMAPAAVTLPDPSTASSLPSASQPDDAGGPGPGDAPEPPVDP